MSIHNPSVQGSHSPKEISRTSHTELPSSVTLPPIPSEVDQTKASLSDQTNHPSPLLQNLRYGLAHTLLALIVPTALICILGAIGYGVTACYFLGPIAIPGAYLVGVHSVHLVVFLTKQMSSCAINLLQESGLSKQAAADTVLGYSKYLGPLEYILHNTAIQLLIQDAIKTDNVELLTEHFASIQKRPYALRSINKELIVKNAIENNSNKILDYLLNQDLVQIKVTKDTLETAVKKGDIESVRLLCDYLSTHTGSVDGEDIREIRKMNFPNSLEIRSHLTELLAKLKEVGL